MNKKVCHLISENKDMADRSSIMFSKNNYFIYDFSTDANDVKTK